MNMNDLIKFMVTTGVKYIDQPKEERTKLKIERKMNKEPFLSQWFGILPMSAYLYGTEVRDRMKDIKVPKKLIMDRFKKVN